MTLQGRTALITASKAAVLVLAGPGSNCMLGAEIVADGGQAGL